jgi:hypothetical protein
MKHNVAEQEPVITSNSRIAAPSGVRYVMCVTSRVTEPVSQQHMAYELKLTLAASEFQSIYFLFWYLEVNNCNKRPYVNGFLNVLD